MDRRKRIEVREEQGVIIVTFIDKRIIDEGNIARMGEDLFSLVDQHQKKDIVLDFRDLEYMSTAALGKFITLNKKCTTAGGKLVLCNISNEGQGEGIHGVFMITKLHRLFAGYFHNDWQQPNPDGNIQKALELFSW